MFKIKFTTKWRARLLYFILDPIRSKELHFSLLKGNGGVEISTTLVSENDINNRIENALKGKKTSNNQDQYHRGKNKTGKMFEEINN